MCQEDAIADNRSERLTALSLGSAVNDNIEACETFEHRVFLRMFHFRIPRLVGMPGEAYKGQALPV